MKKDKRIQEVPAEQMEDEDIISLYFARDEDAIRYTDISYGRRLLNLAYRVLASHEDARECKSDTYLSAWNTIPPTRPLCLSSYLLKICRNHALDRLDRKRTKKRGAVLVELTAELANCIPGGSVEEEVDAREIGRLLSAFLKKLPEEERYIMMARCFSLKTTAEIASTLVCREGRVRTILYRTRKQLKNYLEVNGYETE